MVKLDKVTEKTWWIAMSSDRSVIHEGELLPNMELISGQDDLETFTSEQTWLDRLKELGVTPINNTLGIQDQINN